MCACICLKVAFGIGIWPIWSCSPVLGPGCVLFLIHVLLSALGVFPNCFIYLMMTLPAGQSNSLLQFISLSSFILGVISERGGGGGSGSGGMPVGCLRGAVPNGRLCNHTHKVLATAV